MDLKSAIDEGHPVLISTHKWFHYSVVYGYSDSHYFVMNPSLGDMGSLLCAVTRTSLSGYEMGGRWKYVDIIPDTKASNGLFP